MASKIDQVISRYDQAVSFQASDPMRAAYFVVSKEVIQKIKRASSKQLVSKMKKFFGKVIDADSVSENDRYDMVNMIFGRQMKMKFGDYVPAPSAQVIRTSILSVATKPRSTGRFDEGQIKDMRIQHLIGESYRKIGDKYGVSGDMIRSICIGECYREVHTELIDRPAKKK